MIMIIFDKKCRRYANKKEKQFFDSKEWSWPWPPKWMFFSFHYWSFFSYCPFENSCSHRCHIALHSFFPSWTERTCCFIWSFQDKLQSQILHLNDLFSSWTDSKSFFMASFRVQLSRTFALIIYVLYFCGCT